MISEPLIQLLVCLCRVPLLSAFKLYGVAVRHPWVDVAGVVANHPRLHPWDPNNSIGRCCAPMQPGCG